jgi:hypothetical protein
MAFCNSCGASIAPGTRFCNKCGAAIAGTPATSNVAPAAGSTLPASSATPASAGQGGGAMKAVLIVVGVIVLVGILGVTTLAFLAWHVARHTRVHQEGDHVRVETPFGTVQTTKDPQEAARNLGVDIYPGAEISKEGAATATIGGIHTVALNFVSPDSRDKVCDFYKARFPSAMVMTSDPNQCTIVSNDKKNMITISIKTEGDKTRIVITNVSKADAANSSSN